MRVLGAALATNATLQSLKYAKHCLQIFRLDFCDIFQVQLSSASCLTTVYSLESNLFGQSGIDGFVAGLQAKSKSNESGLRLLNLAGNMLGMQGAQRVARLMMLLPKLQNLDVFDNCLGDDGFALLLSKIPSQPLVGLK
jgi:hypothetical protein